MFRRLAILSAITAALAMTFAGGAAALTGPTTMQAVPGVPGYHCTVFAGGPQFVNDKVVYGGWVTCTGASARHIYKAIKVALQVKMANGYWRSAEILYSGPFPARPTGALQPATLSRGNTTHLLHGEKYRVWVWTDLNEPNGHAGCSLHGPWGCYQNTTAVVVSPVRTAP